MKRLNYERLQLISEEDYEWIAYANILIIGSMKDKEDRMLSFSKRIHDIVSLEGAGKDRKNALESFLFSPDLAGKRLENVDVSRSLVDSRSRLFNANELTKRDIQYFLSKEDKKLGLESGHDISRLLKDYRLEDKDIDFLHKQLAPELKEFLTFSAACVREMHLFQTRNSGLPYAVHPFQVYANHFDSSVEHFELPIGDLLGFKTIDDKVFEILKKGDIQKNLINIPDYDRSFLKPNFEQLVLALMHDITEELSDILIENYKPDKKGLIRGGDGVDPVYREKIMALLYGLMLEMYVFVRENERIKHKQFFYRTIKSIGYGLSNLTKDRFQPYLDYLDRQVLHPEDIDAELNAPFSVPYNSVVKHIPKIYGYEDDMPSLVSLLERDVLKRKMPEEKKLIDRMYILSTKMIDHRANSMDMEHYGLSKTIAGLFKAKALNEIFAFEYMEMPDDIMNYYAHLFLNYEIQVNYSMRFLYDAVLSELGRLRKLDRLIYSSDLILENSDKDKRGSVFQRALFSYVNELADEYMSTPRFSKLTEPSLNSPYDGMHYHSLRMMSDKEYERRFLAQDENLETMIGHAVLLYATYAEKRMYLVPNKKGVRRAVFLPGHSIKEIRERDSRYF